MINRKNHSLNNKSLVVVIITFAIMCILTVISIFYFNYQIMKTNKIQTQEYQSYTEHYAFITDDLYDSFWQEVYEGAQNKGEELNIKVERFGENIKNNYSKAELLRMAIASNVDGIILQGDESQEIKDLVAEAEANGIPVVTVLTDISNSSRKSFIGVGGYNLGKAYAREIIRIATSDTQKILLLIDNNKEENNQRIVLASMKETITSEGNFLNLDFETKLVDNYSSFSAEEDIRDIFLNTEALPDMIICLNEENTISAYQNVVDYNIVGKIEIIGYYTSETILKAIEKNVIASTIAVDTGLMGKACIDTLHTYIETGHVTDYVAIDVKSVTSENVKEYKENVTEETEN